MIIPIVSGAFSTITKRLLKGLDDMEFGGRVDTRLDGQGDPLRDMQEIQIWLYEQMVYAKLSTCPREWLTQTPMGCWHTNGAPNLG